MKARWLGALSAFGLLAAHPADVIAASYAPPAVSPCGTGDLNADCTLKSTASALSSINTALNSTVVSGTHNTMTGHLLLTQNNGTVQDAGIANRKGNLNPETDTLTNGATIAIAAGVGLEWLNVSGIITTGTILLPSQPQDGDILRLSIQGAATIASLTIKDATSATTVTTFTTLAPLVGQPASELFGYRSSCACWTPAQ